jgi:F-type H+-transporting ATPase subunit epsilon
MFKLSVLTPERKAVFDKEILEVSIPAHSGEVTILPGHSPMITTLGTGILRYKVKGEEKAFKALVSWGYCEVSPQGVNVLAEFMQTPEEVSADAAQTLLQAAEKRLVSEVLSDKDFDHVMGEADRARGAINLIKH